MLAGAGIAGDGAAGRARHRLERRPSPVPGWRRRLPALRSPEGLAARRSRPGAAGHAAALSAGRRAMAPSARQLGLGACLADDMGLGKTIQVLSLLLVLKNETGRERKPSLLVAPASLLANWAAEIERFAPSLKALVAHPSAAPRREAEDWTARMSLADVDLVITSYGYLARAPWLGDHAMAAGRARRSAGHQESGRQADQSGQEAQGRGAHCPDRHADREPARRPLVDLRFHQSRTAGLVQAVLDLRQASRRPASQSLRTAARTGASLHPAPHEDRQEHHRRPAGQDRGERRSAR